MHGSLLVPPSPRLIRSVKAEQPSSSQHAQEAGGSQEGKRGCYVSVDRLLHSLPAWLLAGAPSAAAAAARPPLPLKCSAAAMLAKCPACSASPLLQREPDGSLSQDAAAGDPQQQPAKKDKKVGGVQYSSDSLHRSTKQALESPVARGSNGYGALQHRCSAMC